MIIVKVKPKKLSGFIHVNLLVSGEQKVKAENRGSGKGKDGGRGGGGSGKGWASTVAEQQESRCHGDRQEEGGGAWMHGEPCPGGGCGVG